MNNLDKGTRVLIILILNAGLGLCFYWYTFCVQVLEQKPILFSKILANGELFPFSWTLIASSFASIQTADNTIKNRLFKLGFVLLFVSFIGILIYTGTFFQKNLPSINNYYLFFQIAIASCAIVFALIVEHQKS